MTDDMSSDQGREPDIGQPPGMPRWVKASAVVVAVLVVLIIVVLATGIGGEHGPGRHSPSGSVAMLV